ncbi:MAG: flagellar assembly peptidoglycan hydrolase FlgJ [Pseudomonadota bacterium]
MIKSGGALPTATALYANTNPLKALAAQSGEHSETALRQAAQQFEALFVQMLFANMRNARLADGLLDSQGSKFYQEMHDKQLALALSSERGGGLGIAEMLVRQLRPATSHPPAVEVASSPQRATAMDIAAYQEIQNTVVALRQARTHNANAPSTAGPTGTNIGSDQSVADFASPAAFVESVWPHAEAASRKLGVPPVALVAQAALESGWGQHIPKLANGASSHNLFGIKSTGGWSGPVTVQPTREFKDGELQPIQDSFRVYPGIAESFNDYAALLSAAPRYRLALAAAADPETYFKALQEAGYATDPGYAEKLMAVMSGPTMRAALNTDKPDAG